MIMRRKGEVRDVYGCLFEDRIVFLGSPIDDVVANHIIAQLLLLASRDEKKEVNLYINSPGGSVTAGLAIYDTMQLISCPVATICIGQAASMGAVLLAAGAKGRRSALPHAKVMLHQPLGGVGGQASDVALFTQELLRTREVLNTLIAHHTGQKIKSVERDTDRDFFMSAPEAQKYGIVDRVIQIESSFESS